MAAARLPVCLVGVPERQPGQSLDDCVGELGADDVCLSGFKAFAQRLGVYGECVRLSRRDGGKGQ